MEDGLLWIRPLYYAMAKADLEHQRGVDDKTTASLDIDSRVLGASFVGGAIGLVLMVPILAGVPLFLGLFEAEPIVDIAGLGRIIGLEPSFVLGLVFFALGGTVALPLLFVVASGFLPPASGGPLRGVVFATILWTGFAIAFWPGWESGVLFLALSLTAHWVYGYTLGVVVEYLSHIPEHRV